MATIQITGRSATRKTQPTPAALGSAFAAGCRVVKCLWREFYLEISGSHAAVVSVRRSRIGISIERDNLAELSAGLLRASLRRVGYAHQPLTVILHPPTVCVKIFKVSPAEQAEWLASHLQEVFPPGNRHEMQMLQTQIGSDQLLVAIVRRSLLHEVCSVIRGAHGSVKAVVPAAAYDLVAQSNGGAVLIRTSQWSLVGYEYGSRDGTSEIRLNRNGPQIRGADAPTDLASSWVEYTESGSHASTANCVYYKTPVARDMDFLTQLRIPRPLDVHSLSRVVRLSLAVSLVLLAAMVLSGLVQIVHSVTTGSNQNELAELNRTLAGLSAENRRLQSEYQAVQPANRGEHVGGQFLQSLAQTVPSHGWLSRLELTLISPSESYQFRANGYSWDEGELASFPTALRSTSSIAEASLTRASNATNVTAGKLPERLSAKLVQFDLVGKTR